MIQKEMIQKDDYYRDTLYFFGAGIPAIIGAPLFKDLTKMISDQNILSILNIYDNYSPEELYNTIEICETVGVNKLISENTTNIIWEALYNAIEFSIDYDNTMTTYKTDEWFKKIFNSNSAIITTNYDITPERCLYDKENSYLKKNKIYYGGYYRDIIPYFNEGIDKTDGKYSILKLRGSSNWGYCEKCGTAYYFNEDNYHKLTQYECKYCSDHSKLRKFIIPPTYSNMPISKINEPPNDTLRGIWYDAWNLFRLSKNIVFAGYSFPESDIQIRYLILDALNENYRVHFLEDIIVVTDNKSGYEKIEFEEKYKSIISKVIPKPKIEFYYEGFEQYCRDEI